MLVLFRPVAADGLTDSLTTINKDMQVGAAKERDTLNKRPATFAVREARNWPTCGLSEFLSKTLPPN